MAGRSTRWETDPLFSAAEVVQDSADRMESLYRLLMHELDLVHEDHHKDHRMLGSSSSLQFHRRNLVTAVETARWQLEDFERAVHAISDETGSREHAIHGHRQFIGAIREQVLQVQSALQEMSVGDSGTGMQWATLNEPDAAGLASFLSGDNSPGAPQSNVVVGELFLGSAGAADEIIEVGQPDEAPSEPGDMRHLNHASSSNYHSRVPGNLENGYKTMDDVANRSGPGAGESTTRRRLLANSGAVRYLLELMNRFWRSDRYGHSRTFTKKRKDGEIMDDTLVETDYRRKRASYSLDISSAGQSGQPRMCSASGFGICPRPDFRELRAAVHLGQLFEPLSRRFERLRGLSQRTPFHLRSPLTALIGVTLVGVLGFGWLMW